MSDLLSALIAEGVTVEPEPEWRTWAAPMPPYVDGFHPIGILNHWDAVRGWNIDTYRDNPRFGEPTYHIPIEKTGLVHLVSQNYVWGAGGGDSAVYNAMRRDRPVPPARIEKDMNGNPHFWAVVVNYYPDSINQSDVGPALPPRQYESLVKVNAALCRLSGWNPTYRVNDHDGWTTRKDDLSGNPPGNWWVPPSNWNLTRFRTDVRRQLDEGGKQVKIRRPEWFDDALWTRLSKAGIVSGPVPEKETEDVWRFYAYLDRTINHVKPWTKKKIAAAVAGVSAGAVTASEVIQEIVARLSGG